MGITKLNPKSTINSWEFIKIQNLFQSTIIKNIRCDCININLLYSDISSIADS